ncbi:MAG: DMT family transporter [Hyphomicrobiaceae bacterium]
MSTTTKALVALTVTMLIWAVVPIVTRLLVTSLDPGDTLVIRYAISTVLFALLLTAMRGWSIERRDWPRFLAAAATGVLGYNVANIYGYQTTSASLGSIIIGIEPAMIAVLATLVLGEPLRWPIVAGCILASIGTLVLLAGEDLIAWLGLAVPAAPAGIPPATDLMGPLLVLLSATSWSVFVVVVKPLLTKYGTAKASAFNGIVGAPMILLLLRSETVNTAVNLTPPQWSYILFLAVLATVLSMFLWNYGVRHVSAASAGAFIYALPVLSVALAVPLLGETLTPAMIAGGLLILAGVAVAQIRT